MRNPRSSAENAQSFPTITSERAAKGDRHQITAKLQPGALQLRKIEGNIYIKTSDKEFPNLVVPVRADNLCHDVGVSLR